MKDWLAELLRQSTAKKKAKATLVVARQLLQ
jgi:hypothetical protein